MQRDAQKEKQAQDWIVRILGPDAFPPGELYEDVLRDGIVLCQLMDRLAPGSVPIINPYGGEYKMLENIENFRAVLRIYGVADDDIFEASDLVDDNDLVKVTETIFALDKQINFHPEWKGPRIQK
ncbi:PREDICTED: muscle-specific protein 20-like [Nicrophorus vespilloides]|uniref:Muscle-specific protein 20-like n=1 Tax=Nicrophorus vespilloides TaxID=110193 RepID=A0ABM1MW64_NICVS|nr:PREDICTED: muscle-specific protein 20-like [Nicrophorus vespilloides]